MRLALRIEYDGGAYHGWQTQRGLPTVQSALEAALRYVAAQPIVVHCAGRTDRGVHAKGQVIHFDTEAIRPRQAWVQGTNARLPADIAVQEASVVSASFHARFSALSRWYRYIIDNHPVRPALKRRYVAWYYQPLDAERMQEAAHYLLGEHDFSAFRAAECESLSPRRHIKKLNVTRDDQYLIIDIEANAFLHHMVRNIVGVLVTIGKGMASPSWMEEVLVGKDRRKAAATAPAAGLYLMKVTYPEGAFQYPWPL